MNYFLDTSVLLPAFVDQLPNHEKALAVVCRALESGNRGVVSTHGLAEAYAVLTALPLPKKIHPLEARAILETNVLARMQLIELTAADYQKALARCADKGLTSGVIYDALHVVGAEKAGCDCLYTYNVTHFRRFAADSLAIEKP